MKLIIGLGNPGKEYANTRLNVGFLCVDKFCNENSISFKVEKSFNAEVGFSQNYKNKAAFLKPLTYMNLSGESIIRFIKYYKVDINDILVIYDDIAIPIGSIRIRECGSSGGHNGIKNIINLLGTQSFKRVRLGVSNNSSIDMKDYVLGNFSKNELITLNIIVDFINDEKFNIIMNRYNKKVWWYDFRLLKV